MKKRFRPVWGRKRVLPRYHLDSPSRGALCGGRVHPPARYRALPCRSTEHQPVFFFGNRTGRLRRRGAAAAFSLW